MQIYFTLQMWLPNMHKECLEIFFSKDFSRLIRQFMSTVFNNYSLTLSHVACQKHKIWNWLYLKQIYCIFKLLCLYFYFIYFTMLLYSYCYSNMFIYKFNGSYLYTLSVYEFVTCPIKLFDHVYMCFYFNFFLNELWKNCLIYAN